MHVATNYGEWSVVRFLGVGLDPLSRLKDPPATSTPQQPELSTADPAGRQDRSRAAAKPSKKSTEEWRSHPEVPGAGRVW